MEHLGNITLYNADCMDVMRDRPDKVFDVDKTYCVDCTEGARILPDNSIDCIVTSPPYYGLRDYGIAGQIGLEQTPEQYIERLVALFHELRRALKDTGTLWVNIGDSYAGSGKGAWKNKTAQKEVYVPNPGDSLTKMAKVWEGIKPKDLIGIPWMFAFAMRYDGWYLRQDIIWSKPNPMPESVTDRCGKAHEYIFLFSKSRKYYFDAESIKQPAQIRTGRSKAIIGGRKRESLNREISKKNPMFRANSFREYHYTGVANKRSVWTVPTKPFKDAHFATYPEELIVDCIKAGCPEGGIVFDPFHGSGTTGIVASKLGRHYLGFELNADYMAIERNRRAKELGIFNKWGQ